jgi:hypothetical protein
VPSTTGICSKVIRTAKPLRIRGARRSYRVKNTLTRLVIFNLPPRHVHRPGGGFVFAGHPMSLSVLHRAEKHRPGRPCPALDRDRFVGYAARPLACQMNVSPDPSLCGRKEPPRALMHRLGDREIVDIVIGTIRGEVSRGGNATARAFEGAYNVRRGRR